MTKLSLGLTQTEHMSQDVVTVAPTNSYTPNSYRFLNLMRTSNFIQFKYLQNLKVDHHCEINRNTLPSSLKELCLSLIRKE